jgi:hypothetical protein
MHNRLSPPLLREYVIPRANGSSEKSIKRVGPCIQGLVFSACAVKRQTTTTKHDEKRKAIMNIMKTSTIVGTAVLGLTLTASPLQADTRVSIHIDDLGAALAFTDRDRPYHYDDWYAPDMLYVPQLGFYVSFGSPLDVFFLNNSYYLHRHGNWYRSAYYRGPWAVINVVHLPHAIRKHNRHTIHSWRDREYRRHTKHVWMRHQGHPGISNRPAEKRTYREKRSFEPAPRYSGRSENRHAVTEPRKFRKEQNQPRKVKESRMISENRSWKKDRERDRNRHYGKVRNERGRERDRGSHERDSRHGGENRRGR